MKREIDASGAASPGFFGRKDEMRDFSDSLESAPVHGVRTFLLAGEPGVGKTRLAEEMAGAAARAGFLTLWGSWRDGARRPEYWIWAQVIRNLLHAIPPKRLGAGLGSAFSELSSLLPEIMDEMPGLAPPFSDIGDQKRLRLFDSVYRLLGRACTMWPVILLFDNLHLAGASSLDLLAGVIGESEAHPLIVIATYRNLPVYRRDPLLSFVSEVSALGSVREVKVRSLSRDDTEAMVAYILGNTPSPDFIREIWERTRGLPLFVREAASLLRQGTEGQRLWKEDFPAALNVAIRLRVKGMPATVAESLRMAAAIGESFLEEELRLACGTSSVKMLEELEEAASHGFLVRGDSPGDYRFAHPLIHAAIRMQLPASKRRILCTRLAKAVENAHADTLSPWALKLMRWWMEAEGSDVRERVRFYSCMAAETAMKSGLWEEAISLYEGILDAELEAADTEETANVLYGLGSAYYWSGNHERGIFLLQKAFACYKRHGGLAQMTRIASEQAYLLVGQPGFYDFFVEVLPLLPSGSPEEASVLHFYGIAQMLSLGDYPGASATFEKAFDIGFRIKDPVIQARNLAGLAFVDNAYGRYAGCVDKVFRVMDLLSGHPDPYAEMHAEYVMGSALIALGRGDEAIPYEDHEIETVLKIRDGVHIASACQLRARHPAMKGSWEEACAFIDQGLAACPDHLFLLAFRAFLEYTRGAFEAGDSYRTRILAIQKRTPTGPWRVHIQAASTAAVRARNSGDTKDLAGYIPLLLAISAHPAAHPFILIRAHLLLGFIAALNDNAVLARAQYKAILNLPRLELVRPYLRERFLGLAAHCSGDHHRAIGHLEKALGLARHYGDRPIEAWILCELGEALIPQEADKDAAQRAGNRLEEAADFSRSLSMPPLGQMAAANLKRMSAFLETGLPPHPHLSGREIEVLRHMSRGLSNRDIAQELHISANTVGNHVCRILEKLGAANRTEAASRARKFRLIP